MRISDHDSQDDQCGHTIKRLLDVDRSCEHMLELLLEELF